MLFNPDGIITDSMTLFALISYRLLAGGIIPDLKIKGFTGSLTCYLISEVLLSRKTLWLNEWKGKAGSPMRTYTFPTINTLL